MQGRKIKPSRHTCTSLHACNLFICHPLPFSMQSVYNPLCLQFNIYTLPAIFLPPPSCIYFSQAVNPQQPEPVFVNLLRSSGIDSHPGGPVRQPYLLYRPAMLHRLAESNPRNRFLVSLNVYKYGLCILVHAVSCLQFSCLSCLPCIVLYALQYLPTLVTDLTYTSPHPRHLSCLDVE